MRAADELARQAEHAAIIERRNALLNVRARAQLVSFVRNTFADRPDLGVESFLVGTNVARKGSPLCCGRAEGTRRCIHWRDAE